MKIVQDLAREINLCEFDPVQRACFRISGPAVGLLSYKIRDPKEGSLTPVLDVFRSLILSSHQLNAHNPIVSAHVKEYISILQRHLLGNRLMICFRANLEASLPHTKSERLEPLRRCAQSAAENSRNLAPNVLGLETDYDDYNADRLKNYFRQMDSFKELLYEHLKNDLTSTVSTYRKRKETGSLTPPFSQKHPLYDAWRNLKSILENSSSTWSVWVDWYEFRFLGLASNTVPNSLWKSIESSLCTNRTFLFSGDETEVNGIFAQEIIKAVEELIDFQSENRFSSSAPEFNIDQDGIVVSSADLEEISAANKVAFAELSTAAERMKKECEKNSAAHLKEDLLNYLESFSVEGWDNPIPFTIRGDRLRRILDAYATQSDDSDLPEVSAETLISFQSLIRSHNFAVSIHPDTRRIDEQLNEGVKTESVDPLFMYREIYSIYKEKKLIEGASQDTLEYLDRSIEESDDKGTQLLLAVSFLGNVVQGAGSWIWKHRTGLMTGSVALTGAIYTTAQWMVAHEAWLLANFGVNSNIGALLRAVLDILHRLPI